MDSPNSKFCKHCGEKIDTDCVVCPKCGKQVEELKQSGNNQPNIVINNDNANTNVIKNSIGNRVRRKRSLLFDIVMIFFTGGLWIIWMILRPKYY